MFFFSKDFGDKMVFPLIALFLRTGNQTANVSCAILELLFDDPTMKLWDYDSETLLPNLPTMVTFPKLHGFYEDWRKDLVSKGVEIRLQTDVTQILQRNNQGIVLQTCPSDPEVRGHTSTPSKTETFDELVLCVLADDALKLFGKTATMKERFVLGGAKFYDDITITHSDSAYFKNTTRQNSKMLSARSQSHGPRKSKSLSQKACIQAQATRKGRTSPCIIRKRTLRTRGRSKCRSIARTTSINSAPLMRRRKSMCTRVYFWIRGRKSCGRGERLRRRRS
jgi:predicted NAD/FAD-binding protein